MKWLFNRYVFFHAASPQCFADMALDEEGGDDRGQVCHHGNSRQRDKHREYAPARVIGKIDDFAVADRRNRDEGHVKTVEQRIYFAADDAIAGRADREYYGHYPDRPQNP